METGAEATPSHADRPVRRGRGSWARIALAVVGLIALLWIGEDLAAYVPRFADWVNGLGWWGPAVFAAGYAVATVAMVPGSLLTLAAGAIFGIVKGFLTVFVGASVGATLAFLVARYVARGWVEQRLDGNDRYAAIDRAVGSQGLKIAVLLRLSPVFPFNLLNYALGLTDIRLRDYVVAHLGMIPGALLYVSYGRAAGAVAEIARGAPTERDTGYYVVLAVGLLATIAVTTIVTRIARRALQEATDDV